MSKIPCNGGASTIAKSFGYDPNGRVRGRDERYESLEVEHLVVFESNIRTVRANAITSAAPGEDITIGSCNSNVVIYGTNVSAYASGSLDITSEGDMTFLAPNVFFGPTTNVYVNGSPIGSGGSLTFADSGSGQSLVASVTPSTVSLYTLQGAGGVGVSSGPGGITVDLSGMVTDYSYANSGPVAYVGNSIVKHGLWSDRNDNSAVSGPVGLNSGLQDVTLASAQTNPWFSMATNGDVTITQECDIWAFCSLILDTDLDTLDVDGTVPIMNSTFDFLVGIAIVNNAVLLRYSTASKHLEMIVPPTHVKVGDVVRFQAGMANGATAVLSTVSSRVFVGVAS